MAEGNLPIDLASIHSTLTKLLFSTIRSSDIIFNILIPDNSVSETTESDP